MEAGNHPTITQIREQSHESWLQDHLKSCERCAAIHEGFQMINQEADNRQQSADELLENSRSRNWYLVSKQLPKTTSNRPWKYGAMVLVLITSFSFWYLFPTDQHNSTPDFDSPYPSPSVFRSSETNSNIPFATFYDNQEYLKARGELMKLHANGEVIFFTGLTYLYQDDPDYDSAVLYLSNPMVTESLYSEVAEFYQALALFRNGDKPAARKLLKDILQNPVHSKLNDARSLMDNVQD